MKKITLKKFQKKYKPTPPPNNGGTDYEGIVWNIEHHEEYIRNKNGMYIWTIVVDQERGAIAVPYKDITNGLGFFIATIARRVEGYEYIKL